MKPIQRMLCLLLAAMLIVSLCACSKKGEGNDNGNGGTTRVTTPDDYSPNPDSDGIYIDSDTSLPSRS